MSDIVGRLRAKNAEWQRHCDDWISRIRETAPDHATADLEELMRSTLEKEAADRIQQIEYEKDLLTEGVGAYRARIEQLERENAELRSELASARSEARKAALEEAAKLIEINTLYKMMCGGEEVEVLLSRACLGDKAGLAYAAAIRRLAEQEGTE